LYLQTFQALKILYHLKALCKDLERGEVKKWLKQILEILMAERGKEERTEQVTKQKNIPLLIF